MSVNAAMPPATSPMTNARGVGVLLLVLALPMALLAAGFALASQTGLRDQAGSAVGASLFLGLLTLWLLTAGVALVRRRPGASLRFPGRVAASAAVLGPLVLLPSALGNRYVSEMVEYAQMFLPLVLTAGLAGTGHLLFARGSVGPARVLHALSPLGVVLAIAILVGKIYRVL